MQTQSQWQKCHDTQCANICPRAPLGYVFAAMQNGIGKVYSPQKALSVGTIFPELNITINEYERGLWDGK
ncbi:MAG: spore coat associated protein CotJA [Bacteroides sp.]|nr:spore coat associated protein CotJA [Bacteroides sp.]